jgi:hypothetical protein
LKQEKGVTDSTHTSFLKDSLNSPTRQRIEGMSLSFLHKPRISAQPSYDEKDNKIKNCSKDRRDIG